MYLISKNTFKQSKSTFFVSYRLGKSNLNTMFLIVNKYSDYFGCMSCYPDLLTVLLSRMADCLTI